MTIPEPDADAREHDVDPSGGLPAVGRRETPLEAEPADVADQDVVVPLDEEDLRG